MVYKGEKNDKSTTREKDTILIRHRGAAARRIPDFKMPFLVKSHRIFDFRRKIIACTSLREPLKKQKERTASFSFLPSPVTALHTNITRYTMTNAAAEEVSRCSTCTGFFTETLHTRILSPKKSGAHSLARPAHSGQSQGKQGPPSWENVRSD